ncbi:sulfotransferase family 2 domain-containing protein [Hyphomicrobium facile]|uniref:Sulfotransferase family protein n=1 Tax=Hyphomicrobium facile TaxID=51670 RepID=A0A1I7NHN1_9HYPH|nr:sulfotransferase family 2 domain-containing protein [Hyphomicrobium facile]SFV34162.1 hypothetical protein SAMN04488557_2239 [Hyphomicrobium facile]
MLSQMQSRRPLVHLHIQKTGGQTFGLRLATAFPPESVRYMEPDLSVSSDAETFKALLKSKQFISGHVHGHLLQGHTDLDIVCLAREPIAQIISYYQHIRREPAHLLYTALNKLSFSRALTLLDDRFFNFQARKLVGAFHPLQERDLVKPLEHWLLPRLYESLDRIRWVAPTDHLDDMVDFISIELGLSSGGKRANINQAPDTDAAEHQRMQEWLRRRADLFAVDLLLYSEVCRRFEAYRCEFIQRLCARDGVPAYDSNVIHNDNGSTLRLVSGWYPPRSTPNWGTEIRMGPSKVASVAYRRNESQKCIAFKAAFIAGIAAESVTFIDGQSLERLDAKVQSGDPVRISVSLPPDRREGLLMIAVPEIYPLCMYSNDYLDNDRVAFSTGDWCFSTGVE